MLTEDQDAELWRIWSASLKKDGMSPDDDTAMLNVAADLAETSAIPVSVIWSSIRHWIDEGLV